MEAFFDSTVIRLQNVSTGGDFGYEYQGQALDLALAADLSLSERLGLRLQAGWLNAAWEDDFNSTYNYGNPGSIIGSYSYRLSAIPITLAPFVRLPLGGLSLEVGAGPTLYLVTFTFDKRGYYSEPTRPSKKNWTWDLVENFDSKIKAALGGQAFAAVVLPLGKRFALTLEGGYRLAPVASVRGTSGWESFAAWTGGSEHDGGVHDNAYVWYTSYIHGSENRISMDFSEDQPTGYDESRHFKFSLGGPFALFGVRVTL
jgi:hypothetical protein